MWVSLLLFMFFIVSSVTSQPDKVTCIENDDIPRTSFEATPYKVAALHLRRVVDGKKQKLNISWAINIDASIKHLEGTWIDVSGDSYLCEYKTPFAQANHSSDQEWFYFLVDAYSGDYLVELKNVPIPPPGVGRSSVTDNIYIPEELQTLSTTLLIPTVTPTEMEDKQAQTDFTTITIMFGLMTVLMILLLCSIMYIWCGPVSSKRLALQHVPVDLEARVPVLLVHPAESAAFQQAVLALAEFLQAHCGCAVAVDMWQRGKIAELGPLRWLAKRVKAAERVLIVAPLSECASSSLIHPDPKSSLPEYSVPAATHDLYPLILNMVASHAKSAGELDKFCVVQLSECRDRGSCVSPAELKVCRRFCLLKDLSRLCKALQGQRKAWRKFSSFVFRPHVSNYQSSTAKLRQALKALG